MQQKELYCQHCKKPLTKNDDTVFCPVCGAPYHRECYFEAGECVYTAVHGTSEQYCDKQEDNKTEQENEQKDKSFVDGIFNTEKCPTCGRPYDGDEKFCPNCRTPRGMKMPEGFVFDTFGGVDEEKSEDGVTARQVRAFTAANTQRYVPKYFALSKEHKVSWNWIAFLIPEGWFFYRRMYKIGIIAIAVSLISVVLSLPLGNILNDVLEGMESTGFMYSPEVSFKIMKAMINADAFVKITAVFSVLFDIALRVLCGLFGDYFYKDFTKKAITENKQGINLSNDAEVMSIGGVHPFMFLIGILGCNIITSYIPTIIDMLGRYF